MDKLCTMALIFLLMVLSVFFHVGLKQGYSLKDVQFSSAEIATHIIYDFCEARPSLFAEYGPGASSQTLQTPSKRLLPWDLLLAVLTLESVKESGDNERGYYSVVSKLPQIYIVPEGKRRGPPSLPPV